jgi:hypothetical protein
MFYFRLLHAVIALPRATVRSGRSVALTNRNRSALLPQLANIAGELDTGECPTETLDLPQPIRQHSQRSKRLIVGGMLTRYALSNDAEVITVHVHCLQCC